MHGSASPRFDSSPWKWDRFGDVAVPCMFRGAFWSRSLSSGRPPCFLANNYNQNPMLCDAPHAICSSWQSNLLHENQNANAVTARETLPAR